MARLKAFKASVQKKGVAASSPLATNHIGYKSGESAGYGLSETMVRASAMEIIAYYWDVMSRHMAAPHSINKEVVEQASPHNQLVYMEKVLPNPIANRDFLALFVWKRIRVGEEDVIIFVSEPATHDRHPANASKNLVRAKAPITIMLTEINQSETVMENMCQIDSGVGGEGSRIVSLLMHHYLKMQLRFSTELQQYFQELRSLSVLDAKDGEAIGEALMVSRGKECTEHVLNAHVALVELRKRYGFVEEFLVGVVDIDTTVPYNPFGKNPFNRHTRLRAIEVHDGKKLVLVLKKYLHDSVDEVSAVRRFFAEVVSMEDLAEMYPFFQPLLERMCFRVVTTVHKGILYQCSKKIVFSLLDVGTDLGTAFVYRAAGDHSTSNTLLSIVGASMSLQLGAIALNHHKNWKVMLREMFYTLTYTRSGILHYRVLTRQEEDESAMVDHVTDAMFFKG